MGESEGQRPVGFRGHSFHQMEFETTVSTMSTAPRSPVYQQLLLLTHTTPAPGTVIPPMNNTVSCVCVDSGLRYVCDIEVQHFTPQG
jgi:hypothetical protein